MTLIKSLPTVAVTLTTSIVTPFLENRLGERKKKRKHHLQVLVTSRQTLDHVGRSSTWSTRRSTLSWGPSGGDV
ncbi:hypothetical protein ANANG_G00222460 [Anguilla anguilla]|uniref:Uncharacterized protein n=1 Tax=Anguilla anguilla TaxID=7936 RepID=A0A9D3M035_ANGAN|nr:hypothetical protein ANANG_G00222460 [Anguilla anguilla]